ncbi:MAG: thioredoxin domain-containing protein [Deltaproteobacteria bacterium]|nr:thioredoxin domain-containing protein [Deltaproteobacteria bacterium]
MNASKTFKLGLLTVLGTIGLSGCQNMMDKAIDSYMDRKGVDAVEKVIDKIVAKKREEARKQDEPSLEDRLKKRVDVNIKGAPVKGTEGAPITIVEFSDFQCPFCKRVLPTVQQVMKDYQGKVKIAFKHNPLPFHPNAMPASKAAIAAGNQGKFWEMYEKLFANQQELTEANFKKWAKELKLNPAKFEKDMKDPATQKQIEEDMNFARANGAGGTPSFFINGVLLVGAQPYEKFKEVIDVLLTEKK